MKLLDFIHDVRLILIIVSSIISVKENFRRLIPNSISNSPRAFSRICSVNIEASLSSARISRWTVYERKIITKRHSVCVRWSRRRSVRVASVIYRIPCANEYPERRIDRTVIKLTYLISAYSWNGRYTFFINYTELHRPVERLDSGDGEQAASRQLWDLGMCQVNLYWHLHSFIFDDCAMSRIWSH